MKHSAEDAPGVPAPCAKRVKLDNQQNDEPHPVFSETNKQKPVDEEEEEEQEDAPGNRKLLLALVPVLEEELGSEDDDDDTELKASVPPTICEWESKPFPRFLRRVKEMSTLIYGRSNTGYEDIDLAVEASRSNTTKIIDKQELDLVGMAVLRLFAPRSEILQVYVSADNRGGVGRSLVEKSLEILKQVEGCKGVDVFAIGWSCGFYKKCGFTVVEGWKENQNLDQKTGNWERCLMRLEFS